MTTSHPEPAAPPPPAAGEPVGLPILFISDLHLSTAAPHTTAAFTAFIHAPARQAHSLYILGDLFENWAGDDDLDEPFNQQITTLLFELAASGTRIFFLAGNRDFLAGAGFARAAKLTLLADPTLITPAAHPILLSHGDALCTDDHAYQHFRQQVRTPAFQAQFLAQPLAARKAIITQLREQSESAKKDKEMALMDVAPASVAALLREHNYPTLIHGHTHRPAQHTHQVDGHACTRHVLADWHDHPTWLRFDGTGFMPCTLPRP
ncbi:UDP-2,3-diacylglucosamine hydrolase [Betaproteobacteria bacterium]|nr:UDP-2,3-diacylglucosamine hydrolase [Betaproteobacteria bacterium]